MGQYKAEYETSSWIIMDWAGNVLSAHGQFLSFDDAEERLCEFLGDDYETDREEYYITETEEAA